MSKYNYMIFKIAPTIVRMTPNKKEPALKMASRFSLMVRSSNNDFDGPHHELLLIPIIAMEKQLKSQDIITNR